MKTDLTLSKLTETAFPLNFSHDFCPLQLFKDINITINK